jgi:asparagine synthase (glutamine-hydrolysing)
MLTAAMDFLDFYGPDGSGVETLGSAVFGHQMLYVTPESKNEPLPFSSEERYLITADARIDNRDELFDALEVPHEKRRHMPDSMLILLAFQKWGVDCSKHLLGDFVAAIWDDAEKRLFCVRDHIGVKPFYYCYKDKALAFASEISALLTFPHVPDILSEDMMLEYLLSGTFHFSQTRNTFYEDIFRLPFSHHMVVSDSAHHIEQYWFPERIKTLHLPNENDYVEQLRELLHEAVACRLRTDYKIGSHLSGGLDSSSVAIMANRMLRAQGKSLHAFAWQPPPSESQEQEDSSLERIRLISEQENIPVTYAPWDLSDQRTLKIDKSLRPTETIAFEQFIQQSAHDEGIRLLLSGWGGDETVSFNGRSIWLHQWRSGQWLALLHNLKGRDQKILSPKTLLKNIPVNFWRRIIKMYWLPSWVRQKIGAENPPPSDLFLKSHIADKTYNYRIDGNERYSEASQIKIFYNGHITMRMDAWSWSAAEHDIVYAYPLTDKRVLSFIYSLPPELFMKQSWNRYIYRVAMEPIFPEGLTWDKYGGVKEEELMGQERFQQLRWHRIKNIPLHELDNNPWIDASRLLDAMNQDLAGIPTVDKLAITRASEFIMMHYEWKNRTSIF